jgi:hypothetical protein
MVEDDTGYGQPSQGVRDFDPAVLEASGPIHGAKLRKKML